MGRSRRTLPASLNELRGDVDRWRARRVRGGPMPPELWDAALDLAATHGIAAVARVVRLDYGSLKKRMVPAAGGPGRAADGQAQFVELDAKQFTRALDAAGPVVELWEPDGRRLVIRFSGHEQLNVPAMVALWRGGRS